MTPIEWYIGGQIAYMLLEYWLGKTDKVKSGSVVELGLNVAKTVLSTVKKGE